MATLSPLQQVFTPAALQGEPAPWAHPTPSPSPLMRVPQEPPLEAGGSSAAGGNGPPPALVTQELLWGVIAPFVAQMLEALVTAIDKAEVDKADIMRQKMGTPSLGMKQEAAFRSLFGPSPAVPTRGAQLRQLKEDNEAEEREEAFESLMSSSSASRDKAVIKGQSHTVPLPQKVQFTPMLEERSNPSRTSSKASSPMLQGSEPVFSTLFGPAGSSAAAAATGTTGSRSDQPQKVYSPSMPEVSDETKRLHMVVQAASRVSPSGSAEERSGYDLGTPYMPNNAQHSGSAPGVVPVYLAWQQQQSYGGFGERNMWADTQLSPNASPMVPMSAPPAEAGQHTAQLVLATAVEPPDGADTRQQEGSSPDLPAPANTEKSVMVCRHWKAKGFCRLEAKCKFLHPEHKRGTVAAPAAKAPANPGNTSSSGAAPLSQLASAAGQDGASKTSRSSRRAGRNRHGTATAGSTSTPAPAAGQAMGQAAPVGPHAPAPARPPGHLDIA